MTQGIGRGVAEGFWLGLGVERKELSTSQWALFEELGKVGSRVGSVEK